MTWLLFFQILYWAFVGLVAIRIIFDTQSSVKTAAYLLLIFAVPIVGVIIYLSFGLNYRKRVLYSKKMQLDSIQTERVNSLINQYVEKHVKQFKDDFPAYFGLTKILYKDEKNFATINNKVELFINGERKFPALIDALKKAKHHIHIEYYIYENDEIGNEIAEILIEKAKEGVEIRFIYDDFGSRSIRKNVVPKLKENGVEAYQFYRVLFILLANRLNYRNHRKIAIIDGETAFVGGINVSDKYINQPKNQLYWRDTHISIKGEGIWSLQKTFLADWNFCAEQNIVPTPDYFRQFSKIEDGQWVQLAASGPDSSFPTILLAYLQAIANAEKEVLITTPYFIPGQEFMKALQMAALRGVNVKLLVPGKSDSYLVNAVSKSHYQDLLDYGVEIYLYQKGFVHAKTMVCDDCFSVIGTANLDNRSFDLNFEVNAHVYDKKIALQLKEAFYNDIKTAEKIDAVAWKNRNIFIQFLEKIFRLAAPLL